jgi:hypothetical protein
MAIISARYSKYISLSVSDKPPDFDTFESWVTVSDKPFEFDTFDAYVKRFGMQNQQIWGNVKVNSKVFVQRLLPVAGNLPRGGYLDSDVGY